MKCVERAIEQPESNCWTPDMRGGVKRSRNGCASCKMRKLKCDETKPSCIRCEKHRVVCPGYGRRRTFSSSPSPGTEVPAGAWDPGLFPTEPRPSPPAGASSDNVATSASSVEASFDAIPDTAYIDNVVAPYHWDYDGHVKSTQLVEAIDVRRRSNPVATNSNFSTIAPTATPAATAATAFRRGSSSRSLPGNDRARNSPRSRLCARVTPPLPGLVDAGSILVEYYFKEVAGLFSCYDSELNPFRSTVSRLWSSSAPVYYVVQSMAAACLADLFPKWHVVGTEMRRKAIEHVEAEITASDVNIGSLLSLVMLGLTASWHNANDLGRKEFNYARKIMCDVRAGRVPGLVEISRSNGRNFQFFQEAMIYWEMLLSYVVDDDSVVFVQQSEHAASHESNLLSEHNFPHPWTGVAKEPQAIVFEVGRLVRQERHRIRNQRFTTSADIKAASKALTTAKQLADSLQQLELPMEDIIVNPGDDLTPVKHLLTIAECYRLAGLLQLQRVFPDLLPGLLTYQPDASSSYTWSRRSETAIDTHLSMLALKIIDLLRTVPIESRTRCVQPFLLVAVASELQLTTPSDNPTAPPDFDDTIALPDVPSAVDKLQARKFVIGRLSMFEHVLPAKPIRQMVEIVSETWRRMDRGTPDVYWMDVMIEKGWETMMG